MIPDLLKPKQRSLQKCNKAHTTSLQLIGLGNQINYILQHTVARNPSVFTRSFFLFLRLRLLRVFQFVSPYSEQHL